MNLNENYFLAKLVANILNEYELIEFVNMRLESGEYFDEYIEILDLKEKNWLKMLDLFKKTLGYRNVTLPDYLDAFYILVYWHLTLIESGSVVPKLQFEKMLVDIREFLSKERPIRYVGDTLGIQTVYSWFYQDECSDDYINAGILSESKKWIQEVYIPKFFNKYS